MKIKNKKELTCCPYCNSEEYYYKEKYKGNCNHYKKFNGELGENAEMYNSAQHTLASVYGYCYECDRKIFKIPLEERY